MQNVSSVIRKHNQTYYDYNTGESRSVFWRYASVFVVSVIVICLMEPISSDALSAILTVQSVLVGFSFSVMFFLLSGTMPKITKGSTIEFEIEVDKLNKLGEELFYNVSYFNVVAIGSLLFAMLNMAIDLDLEFLSAVAKKLTIDGWWEWRDYVFLYNFAAPIISCLLQLLVVSFLVESLFSFVRTVGRVSFYFEKKIKHKES